MNNLNTMIWQEMRGEKNKSGDWNFTLEDAVRRAVEHFRQKYPHLNNAIEVGVWSGWNIRRDRKKVKKEHWDMFTFVRELEDELDIKIVEDKHAYHGTIFFVTGKQIKLEEATE